MNTGHRTSGRRRAVAWAWMVGMGLAVGVRVDGQVLLAPGEVGDLSTTEGAFVSRWVDLTVGLAEGVPGTVRFQIALGTHEGTAPGDLHDSFTATLASADDSLFATILTLDVFGGTLAPTPVGGGIALSPASISLGALTSPMALPSGFGTAEGFSVELPVPAEFSGLGLKIYFDLVTAGTDGAASEGRVFVPAVVPVPEVEAWWLTGLLPAVAVARRMRKWRATPEG